MEDILIPMERYIALLVAEEKLRRLERAGVNNLEWYGDAMSGHHDDEEDDDEA